MFQALPLTFFLLCGLALRAQTGPTSAFAELARKADAARESDRLDEAAGLYRKALDLQPDWTEGWWSLGTLQYDRNDYRAAAAAFEKVAALSPRAGMAWAMLGLCEFELGRDEDALRHIEQGQQFGIAGNPQLQHVVLYHEGALLQRLGKFTEAKKKLHSLCWNGLRSDDAIRSLGMAALQMGGKDPPAAGPRDLAVVMRVGQAECLAGQKKFSEARDEYTAIARDYPGYPEVHYAYGSFLLDARDMQAAFEELRREIGNNPKHVMARLRIAGTEYKVDSAAGLPYAEEAVKLAPGLPLAHYVLGLLLIDTDDYMSAIRELEIVREACPREAKVWLALGAAYARAGRASDAASARAAFLRLQENGQRDLDPLPAAGTEVDGAVPR